MNALIIMESLIWLLWRRIQHPSIAGSWMVLLLSKWNEERAAPAYSADHSSFHVSGEPRRGKERDVDSISKVV